MRNPSLAASFFWTDRTFYLWPWNASGPSVWRVVESSFLICNMRCGPDGHSATLSCSAALSHPYGPIPVWGKVRPSMRPFMKNSRFLLFLLTFVLASCTLLGCTSAPVTPADPGSLVQAKRIVPVCQAIAGTYQCNWIELNAPAARPVPASARRIIL